MLLCATPYDMSVPFWYFDSSDAYAEKYKAQYEKTGTEEYEIQFIEGDDAECQMAGAVDLNQCNHVAFMEFMERGLSDTQLAGAFHLISDNQKTFDEVCEMDEDDLSECIQHECASAHSEQDALKDYAEDLLEASGALCALPENLRYYFDYSAYARDLGLNGMSAFEFNGVWYVCE